MRQSFITAVAAFTAAIITATSCRHSAEVCEPAKITPVSFSQVKIDDDFWLPRIRQHAEITLPACLNQCEYETGRVRNFAIAGGMEEGEFQGIFYDDSDLYKMIEGCAYSLTNYPNPALEARIDSIIDKIASAQQPDGYINTFYTLVAPDSRWTDMDMHEMYCGGHLIEAAIAYNNATGKRSLLDVAVRFADHIDSIFGEGGRPWVPGHEEIELALVKLYHETGQERYLSLARRLLDLRGHGHGTWAAIPHGNAQRQDSVPVADLAKISGHAVRATYLFTGMADCDRSLGDTVYSAALHRLWDDVIGTKMYATGGIGSSGSNEGFTTEFDLPNEEAYCETCASVGMVMWNQRMNLLEGHGRYADILEKTMYNGALAGISLSADRFFYVNPLESQGGHHRQPWYGTACCPSQISRFLPSVGNYIYATTDGSTPVLMANLYIGNSADIVLGGDSITISQTTDYPFDGKVDITVNPAQTQDFELRLRLPGWCKDYTLSVNGKPHHVSLDKQYLTITRRWNPGDKVTFDMDMPVEIVAADPRVKADEGKRHLERGPLVYCIEETDNPDYDRARLTPATTFATYTVTDLPGNITGIRAISPTDTLNFIPYYAWDNRAPGKMKVWIDHRR